MYVISKAVSILDFILFFIFFTPPQNLGGVVFSLQFVCVCVFDSAYEQNSSRTDATILNIIFAKTVAYPNLNGSDPIEIGDLGHGHSDSISIFCS